MPDVRLRPGDRTDDDRLVAVWRRSVVATHLFLTPEEIEGYAARLPAEFLPAVTVTVAQREGSIAGFIGTAAGRIEMLFVDPDAHRSGIGSALLRHAVEHEGATEVDVNEENPGARAFYARKGFVVVARSPVDSDGRPHPVLHLRLPTSASRPIGAHIGSGG